MENRWIRATLVLAALGATLGAALDGIHTHTGTTAYPEHMVWFWKMAWWVPPLFAAAAVAIGLSRPWLDRELQHRRGRKIPVGGMVAISNAGFIGAYFASGFMGGGALARSGVLALLFAVNWALCDSTGSGLVHAFGTAIGGTIVEITLVHFGAFKYLEPDFFGVTSWLPWLYCSAAVATGLFGSLLVDGELSWG